jgi:beta-glucuronidase
MLYPQQNDVRNVLDLSGLWNLALDGDDRGLDEGWAAAPPSERLAAVPGSWNEQFDDTLDFMGPAWYSASSTHRRPAGRAGVGAGGSANLPPRSGLTAPSLASPRAGTSLRPGRHRAPYLGRAQQLVIRVDNTLSPTRVPPGGGQGGLMQSNPATGF